MAAQTNFVEAMREAGLSPPAHIPTEQWKRFPGVGHAHHSADRAGWCKLFAGETAGVYGDWRQGLTFTWFDRTAHKTMTRSARAEISARVKVELEASRELQEHAQAKCANRARELWNSAPAADDAHPYLRAKTIRAHGLRVDVDGSLIIPVYQPDGEISSLQFIGSDGGKRFMPEGKMKQGHFWLGDPSGTAQLLIAEGYSTAASLFEASGMPVCVCFNAGNLLPVSEHVRAIFPQARIVIAGDDDHANSRNTGKEKALAAAKAVGAEAVFPRFSDPTGRTDFNDLHQIDGVEAVRAQLVVRTEGRQRLRSMPIAELLAQSAHEYRVKPVLPARGLAAIIGQSGAGKTFLSLDLAMAIARGQRWFGYRTHACGVVYLAAEGEFGIAQRIRAYLKHEGLAADLPLEVIPFPANLLDDAGDVQAVLEAWASARARMGGAGVLIVDTLSRCMAGGDENSAVDMTRFVGNVDHIRREIDGLLVLVHHLGKDVSKGARGHSSLFAALDACIAVTRAPSGRSWTVAKARESADGEEFAFGLKGIELGLDQDSDPITSCVIDPQSVGGPKRTKPVPRGTNQKLVFRVANELLERSSDLGKGLASGFERCIRIDDLITACQARLPVEAKRAPERVREAVKGMLANGVLQFHEDWIWRT